MTLKSLLGSESLRRLVIHFAAHPTASTHFRALERRLRLSRQSLQNALDTLSDAGLVARGEEGRRVLYRATEHPAWGALRELVRTVASPAEVVGDLFRGVPGVRAALVFGSAAAGTMRPDSDVDVLVVADGAADADLGLAALDAGALLGREIDLKRYTPTELRREMDRPGTGYVQRVLAGPALWAIGSPVELLAS
jgi:predicted nucleotidyltransferase